VNISSAAAYLGSTSGRTHYDASKGGVISFTVSLAREVAKDNITVNAVAPGMIKTEMVEKRISSNLDAYLSRIPLGRIAEPEEVADAVVLLCSERTGYMTGAVLNVSGGLVMG
jgi:3-oxoacyl-[acyl-carrier protein] reductase